MLWGGSSHFTSVGECGSARKYTVSVPHHATGTIYPKDTTHFGSELTKVNSFSDGREVYPDAMDPIQKFFLDDQGQDLIEYSLLMAFVALASVAIFSATGSSAKGIWSSSNSQLVKANTSAS